MKLCVCVLIFAGLFCGCKSNELEYYNIKGYAQGSTYSISYSWDGREYDVKSAIDSILIQFDASLSNYQKGSTISKVNNGDSTVVLDDWFVQFFEISDNVYRETDGAFDITVSPIVNLWGFGYTGKSEVDSMKVDSLLQYVGMHKCTIEYGRVVMDKNMSLISNAVAQGLSVDIVAEFFDVLEVENYLVEIGGELIAKGVSNKGKLWRVGIDKPIDTLKQRELHVAVPLNNQALATSGNYRKFYEKDGVKYSHTVDPRTGYPVTHSLLSATVIAPTCAHADAYATACMVQGVEWSKSFASTDSLVDVLLIYADEAGELQTYYSEKFPRADMK